MLPDGIEVDQAGAVVIARIRVPELAHLQMQEIVEECLERVRCHNAVHVLLDLEGVEFLASACLGPLVAMLQELEHVRGRMALVHCEENVAFLFRVTRLDAVLGVFDDEKAALASL